MNKKYIQLAAVSFSLFFSSTNMIAQTIAQWTFETSAPTTAGPIAPEVGSVSFSAISNTGGTFSSPAGWGSTRSWSSNGWNVGEYFQFTVSTTGFENISVSFQHTGSNTGPRNFTLQYSTDGSTFIDFTNYTVTNDGWTTTNTPEASVKSFNLSSVTALNNLSSLVFRLTMADTVAISSASAVAGTGTSRVDNFTVSSIPEPSTYTALTGAMALSMVLLRRRRRASVTA